MRRFLSFLMASDTARWSSKKGEFCAYTLSMLLCEVTRETLEGCPTASA
jgi:hypothetical protein